MKQIFHTLLMILFSFSVLGQAQEKIATQSSFPKKTEIDSLRDPIHYYYLSDLPLKKSGALILSDSIRPTDNYITFSIMDTITGCSKSDLSFYLKVVEKILYNADGALAEAVGSYTWDFIEKRPDEFIRHLDTLNNEQIIKWAQYTFAEMYFTYSKESLKTKCDEMVSKLKKIKNTKGVSCFEKEMNERIKNGI